MYINKISGNVRSAILPYQATFAQRKEEAALQRKPCLEAGVQITADLVWSPSSGEEAGGIPKDVRNVRDVSQGDFDLLLGPSQLGGKALVFYFGSRYKLGMGSDDDR